VTVADRLAAMRGRSADSAAIEHLASEALEEGEEDRVLPIVAEAAARSGSARLWQWTGLLKRSIDEHADALDAFVRAARSAPQDAGIAHGLARTMLEAGIDARGAFDRARALAPANSDVLLGQAAARLAAGEGEQAAAEIDAILAQVPLWIAGHVQLAQLRALIGEPGRALGSVERALAAQPGEEALWTALFDLHLRREDHAALAAAVRRAQAAGIGAATWRAFTAVASAELGEVDAADAAFAAAGDQSALIIWRIRHALRTGRIVEAIALIDVALAGPNAPAAWPYAVTAWRLAGDPRADWLIGQPGLVATFDLGDSLVPPDRLAALLRSLHRARGEYLDQSVRGGTQTDGPLLSRTDPDIRAVRAAIVAAVERYRAALPPADPRHPLLAPRRDRRVRFAGSWSVRLASGGRHANHVHQQGWISSALYVALPLDAGGEAGWLALGEPPPNLGLAQPAVQLVEPRPGRLVLFPSWMWHGTRAFPEGERLTIAFDVAPPR